MLIRVLVAASRVWNLSLFRSRSAFSSFFVSSSESRKPKSMRRTSFAGMAILPSFVSISRASRRTAGWTTEPLWKRRTTLGVLGVGPDCAWPGQTATVRASRGSQASRGGAYLIGKPPWQCQAIAADCKTAIVDISERHHPEAPLRWFHLLRTASNYQRNPRRGRRNSRGPAGGCWGCEPLPPTPSPARRGGEEETCLSCSPSPLRGGGWGEGFSHRWFRWHGGPDTMQRSASVLFPRGGS